MMERRTKCALMLSVGAAALLGSVLTSSAAWAAVDAAPEATLGEVVVTAQKREENLQKAAVAVTALTADRIESANINQPVDLQFSVPSMTASNLNGYSFVSLRGVGTDVPIVGEASVASYQDGVYTGLIITQSMPTFDLQRIEVLRGPQGTLYGRNTTGGVINYIFKPPTFTPGVYAQASYGNYDAVAAKVGVTGPLVEDKVAARASFNYVRHDGYFLNLSTGEHDYYAKTYGGRLALLLTPTDDFTVDIRGDVARDRRDNPSVIFASRSLDGFTDALRPYGIFSAPASFFQTNNQCPTAAGPKACLSPADIAKLNGGTIASLYGFGPPSQSSLPDPLKTGTFVNGVPTLSNSDVEGVSATVNWRVAGVDLKSITAFRESSLLTDTSAGGVDMGFSAIRGFRINSDQWTQEFNVSGKSFDDKLTWLAGAFYLHDDARIGANSFTVPTSISTNLRLNLSNPASSPFVYNLNATRLTPFTQFPGIPTSVLQTLAVSSIGVPGEGPYRAGDRPDTAFASFLQETTTTSLAGFVQLTYSVTDRLRLSAGARYTEDHKHTIRSIYSNNAYDLTALARQGASAAAIEASLAANLCHRRESSRTWTAPTGMVGVEFDAAPRVLTYARVSRGYKAGGMNTGECDGVFNPEYLTAWEGGAKAVWADGQILSNLALYYYDYKDIQFTRFVPGTTVVQNVGSATAYGAELEFAIRPRALEGFTVDGSVSYEHSEYGDGCFADPARTNNAQFLANSEQRCPATVVNAAGQTVAIAPWADITGNQLIRAPEWKFNIGAEYEADLDGNGRIVARVDASWTDTIYNDIFNGKTPNLAAWTQPSYWLLNARVGWTSPDDRYTVEVYGQNLTDEIYSVSRSTFNSPAQVYTTNGQLGAPRTYGVRVSMKLGSAQ